MSIQMWNKLFFEVIHESKKDILKEKICKAWGEVIQKEADAVMKAMGTRWESQITRAKAREDLKSEIQKIYKSAK